MNYLIIADTTSDNQPLGVMIIDTPDINLTLKEVFDNEVDCDHIRFGLVQHHDKGMMMDWSFLDVVYREEDA